MAEKRKWDMKSANSCAAGAEWFRKQTGALLVLVVRAEDIAFTMDPHLAPRDAEALVMAELPGVRAAVEQQRQEARRKVERPSAV